MAISVKDAGVFFRRYPIGISGVLASVLLLAGYMVRGNRVAELDARLQEVEAQKQKVLKEVHDAANLPEQFSAMNAATKEMDSRLLRGTDRASNQAYFYELEMETGVKEVSLQPGGANSKKTQDGSYDRIGYAITVTGDYRQILNFVGLLETGRHFYHLVSASAFPVENSGPVGKRSTVTLSMNAELLGLP
jgi:Tfp pilus assembly protein PilO